MAWIGRQASTLMGAAKKSHLSVRALAKKCAQWLPF